MTMPATEKEEWPPYRFYTSVKEHGGSCVFDLWAGEFTAAEAAEITPEYIPAIGSKPGVVFINEDAFKAFLPVLRNVLPDFDWYGGNRFTPDQCRDLLVQLKSLHSGIEAARSLEEMKKLCGGHLYIDGWQFGNLKEKLTALITDFILLVQGAAESGVSLWVQGL
jgi:hypothetical protein